MSELEIKIADKSNLEEIVSFNNEIFESMYKDKPYSFDQYQERLKDKEPLIYWAKADDEIVGNSISFARDESWYLWILGIRKDFRNRGLGSKIIDLNELHAKDCKYKFITAKVYNVSKEMLRLLLNRGYYITDVDVTDVNPKYNAVILEKKL